MTYPAATMPQASSSENVTRGPKKMAVSTITTYRSPVGRVAACSTVRGTARWNRFHGARAVCSKPSSAILRMARTVMAAMASRHTPAGPGPPQPATKVFRSAGPKVPSSPAGMPGRGLARAELTARAA